MAECPSCHRNSLDYSYGRMVAWCLYVNGCGFEEPVENYQKFHENFSESESTLIEPKNTCQA